MDNAVDISTYMIYNKPINKKGGVKNRLYPKKR
jgi:hypothetical protein